MAEKSWAPTKAKSANPKANNVKVAKNSLGDGNNAKGMPSSLKSAAGFAGKNSVKVSGIKLGNHVHSPTSNGFEQHNDIAV